MTLIILTIEKINVKAMRYSIKLQDKSIIKAYLTSMKIK